MNKVQLSYIAGIVDGEGSINICRVQQKDCLYYSLKVAVEMSNKTVPEYLLKTTGTGSLRSRKRYNSQTGKQYKTAYEWMVSSKKAVDFLKLIKPYLVQKTEEVNVAIEYQKTVTNNVNVNKKGRFTKIITRQLLEKRTELYKKLKELHSA